MKLKLAAVLFAVAGLILLGVTAASAAPAVRSPPGTCGCGKKSPLAVDLMELSYHNGACQTSPVNHGTF